MCKKVKSIPKPSLKEEIETLQRWILVASVLYYEFNTSIARDGFYDKTAYSLVDLQNNNKEIVDETQYGYVFMDFDGSTGFDLYHNLKDDDKEQIEMIAIHVLRNQTHIKKKGANIE